MLDNPGIALYSPAEGRDFCAFQMAWTCSGAEPANQQVREAAVK
jgi:hypothetical protein